MDEGLKLVAGEAIPRGTSFALWRDGGVGTLFIPAPGDVWVVAGVAAEDLPKGARVAIDPRSGEAWVIARPKCREKSSPGTR